MAGEQLGGAQVSAPPPGSPSTEPAASPPTPQAAARPQRALGSGGRTRVDLLAVSHWRAVWIMGVPGMARSFLASVIQITNLAVVGHLGADAIAAVGIANRFLFLIIAVLGAVTVGTTALVARSIGARDERRCAEVIHQSLILSLIIGVVLALAGVLLSGSIVRALLVLEPAPDLRLRQEATTYMIWSLAPMALGVIGFMGTSIFQAAGDLATPLWVLTASDLLNLGLAYVLVYGVGPVRSMGVAGAGLASGVARIAASFACLWLLRRRRDFIRWRPAGWRLSRRTIREVLDIGIPAGIENLLRQGSFIAFSVIVAALGSEALAANQIVQSLQGVSFNISFGFSIAATALIGQNLGAGREDAAAASVWAANWISLGLSAVLSLAFFLYAAPLSGLFTQGADPGLIALAATCARILAFGQLGSSLNLVLAGGLRGAGDTRWVMYITAVGTWVFRLGLAFLLGIVWRQGLPGIWVAVAIDQSVRGLLTIWRFRGRRWAEIFRRQESARAASLRGHAAQAAT
jgi:putative MATE family efflux protein